MIDFGSEAELMDTFPGYERSLMVGVWEGVFSIEEGGDYTFSTRSDDGSHLWVDGAKVVDNAGMHGALTRSGNVEISKGWHTLRADYFEHRGGDVMQAPTLNPHPQIISTKQPNPETSTLNKKPKSRIPKPQTLNI